MPRANRPAAAAGTADAVRIYEGAKLVPIGTIKPDPKNPRQHSEEQIEKIAASIRELGFNTGIGVWKRVIVDGEGRYLAARKLGMTHVPVVILDHMTPTQRRAYLIAANKLATLSTWDPGKLNELIESLSAEGVDAASVGFSDEELRRLLDDLDRQRLQAERDAEPGEGEPGEEEEDEGEDEEEEEDSTLVPFTVMVSIEEREEIYRKINQAKGKFSVGKTATALLKLMREWTP